MSIPNTTDSYTTKVLALLAKAESSEFPAEAEAFIAKAQELMARHCIDDAMLTNATPGATEQVIIVVVDIPAPYAKPKALLLSVIAKANGCQALLTATGQITLIGHPGDLDTTQTLFTALAYHAVRTMTNEPESGKAFRHGFLVAFASRIGDRLTEARATAHADYERETGTSTALVLADRSKAVRLATKEAFPRTGSSRIGSSSRTGRSAGTAAANTANLGQRSVSGGTRAIGA